MQLRQATPTEQAARDIETYAAWGEQLTLPQYLQREARLRAHPWPKQALRTWILEENGGVLASCETYAMPAFRGEVALRVEGIASVFVAEPLRGTGHASALMQRLTLQLQASNAAAALLFSDVGPELYARCGFVARPALQRELTPEPGDASNVCDRLFSSGGLPAELARAILPDDALRIWPGALQLDWHCERESIYAEALGRTRPSHRGAVAGNARIVWVADFKSGLLRILLLSATRTDEALALLQAAQRMAHACGLGPVVLWECAWPFELPEGGAGGKQVRRTIESIPMILPLVPGIAPAEWGNTARATWI
jgi:predicted N-acetyltransferase YhbS